MALSPLTWPLTFEAETRQRYMSEGEGGGSGKEENGEHGVKSDSTLFSSLSWAESTSLSPSPSLVSYHARVLVNNETRQVEKLFAHVSLKHFGRSIERDRNLCRGYARNRWSVLQNRSLGLSILGLVIGIRMDFEPNALWNVFSERLDECF